jgi:hypothetical protein
MPKSLVEVRTNRDKMFRQSRPFGKMQMVEMIVDFIRVFDKFHVPLLRF